MVRPKPLVYDWDAFRQSFGTSSSLSGQVALVSGSSRGFGALLAIGCALSGADVVLHYHSNQAEVVRVSELIVSALGRRCIVVQGDLRDAATWERAATDGPQRVRPSGSVRRHNAYPPIVPLQLEELTEPVLGTHVFDIIGGSLRAYRVAVAAASRESKGCAVNISFPSMSSSRRRTCFTTLRSSRRSEGSLRWRSPPRLRRSDFLTARPARMLTEQDQRPDQPASAGVAVRHLPSAVLEGGGRQPQSAGIILLEWPT
jgi:hypothetical protein